MKEKTIPSEKILVRRATLFHISANLFNVWLKRSNQILVLARKLRRPERRPDTPRPQV